MADTYAMNIFIELKNSYGSQKKAADAFNVSGATFSDWISNKKTPSKANIILLRKAGFSAEQIFNSVFTENQQPTHGKQSCNQP